MSSSEKKNNNSLNLNNNDKANKIIKCVNCSHIPLLNLNYEKPIEVKIKCDCSYNKQISLKEYVASLPKSSKTNQQAFTKGKFFCKNHLYHVNEYYCLHCQKNICYLCLKNHNKHQFILFSKYCNENKIKNIKTNIVKAENFLSLYNIQIKENLIHKLKEEILTIEQAYQVNYDINSNLLEFAKILLNNYLSIPMNFNSIYNLLNNTTFNFTKINPLAEVSPKNIAHLINYYKNNFIIVKPSKYFSESSLLEEKSKEPANLSKLTKILTLNGNLSYINSLLVLEDGRIASCFGDKLLNLFNLDEGKCEITLKKENHNPVYISQLDKCKIMSCSIEGDIIIWNINKIFFSVEATLSEHTDSVWKVIPISNNRIASCSYDTTIKIYKKYSPYSLIATMSGNDLLVCSIIQIKGKEILVSASDDTNLIFWNLKTYKKEHSIMGVDCSGNSNLIQVDKDRIISGGIEGIYVVNFKVYQIEATIKNKLLGFNQSVLLLRDGTLLASGSNGMIFQYNMSSFTCISSSKVNTSKILNLVRIKDNSFGCSTEDNNIIVFEY